VLAGIAIVSGLFVGPQAIADFTTTAIASKTDQVETRQFAQVGPSELRARVRIPNEVLQVRGIDPRQIPEILAAEEAQHRAAEAAQSANPNATDTMKVSGNATCFCEATCSDGKGGSVTKNFTVGNFSWPHTEAKKQNCNNLCAQTVAAQAANWAQEGGLCPNGTCTGTSKLSTTEYRPLPTHNWTRECPRPPPGQASACCAPFTGSGVAQLFDFIKPSVGDVTTNYQIKYTANAAFDAKMNAFATLAGLNQAGCNPSVVKYEIRNKATNALVFTMTATYSGSGAPILSPLPAAGTGILPGVSLPPDNATYTLLASGGCAGYTASDCKPKGFEFDIRVAIINGKLAPGGIAASDGSTQKRIVD
jgi:hypothetical protein